MANNDVRECNKCVYSTRDGNCRKWICEGTKTVDDIRLEAIDECIKTVHDYFCKLLDEHKEWEIDSIDDFALIPNKNICKALEQLKEQRNE